MRPFRQPPPLDAAGRGGPASAEGPAKGRPIGGVPHDVPPPDRRTRGMTALPTARPEEVGLSTARLRAMGAVLDERVAAGHLPGAVVLVARQGRIAWQEAHGRRDPAAGAPMRTDTIFRIYSMTKPLVSVGVMMLLEEGRLLL